MIKATVSEMVDKSIVLQSVKRTGQVKTINVDGRGMSVIESLGKMVT